MAKIEFISEIKDGIVKKNGQKEIICFLKYVCNLYHGSEFPRLS